MTRGLVDEDEDAEATPTDRSYWEHAKGTKETVSMADQALEIVRGFDPSLELKYNKFYIGLARNGQPNNFVLFRPKKGHMILELKLNQSEEIDAKINNQGLDTLEYDKRWRAYRIRLGKGDIKKHIEGLRELMQLAFEYRNG
jgi:hypothetical protein